MCICDREDYTCVMGKVVHVCDGEGWKVVYVMGKVVHV